MAKYKTDYATLDIPEMKSTFRNPGFSIRKTASLKRREAGERAEVDMLSERNKLMREAHWQDFAERQGEEADAQALVAKATGKPVVSNGRLGNMWQVFNKKFGRTQGGGSGSFTGFEDPAFKALFPVERDSRGYTVKKGLHAGKMAEGAGEVMPPKKPLGAKISAQSFSAGSSDWAGRTADSNLVSNSFSASTKSLKDSYRQGTGSTNGLTLRTEGSLFDNPMFARNREIEKGIGQPSKPKAQPFESQAAQSTMSRIDEGTAATTVFDKAKDNSILAPITPVKKTVADAQSTIGSSYGLGDGREQMAAMYGGDVMNGVDTASPLDTMTMLSTALNDGLGDPKLLQAAIRSGGSFTKKYKNLSAMGVV